jgi:hypothetical protein
MRYREASPDHRALSLTTRPSLAITPVGSRNQK